MVPVGTAGEGVERGVGGMAVVALELAGVTGGDGERRASGEEEKDRSAGWVARWRRATNGELGSAASQPGSMGGHSRELR